MHAPVILSPRIVDADGTIEGYASLFGAVDQARDMVAPGAFRETLELRGLRRIPMLFQHDPAEPIGVWLELKEDWRGLYARGRLIPDVQRAREVLALLKSGAIDGLSIGFRTLKARVDPATKVRKLHHIDLWEISIVTFPLLDGARVESVRAMRWPERAVKKRDPDARYFERHPRFVFRRGEGRGERAPVPRSVATALRCGT